MRFVTIAGEYPWFPRDLPPRIGGNLYTRLYQHHGERYGVHGITQLTNAITLVIDMSCMSNQWGMISRDSFENDLFALGLTAALRHDYLSQRQHTFSGETRPTVAYYLSPDNLEHLGRVRLLRRA